MPKTTKLSKAKSASSGTTNSVEVQKDAQATEVSQVDIQTAVIEETSVEEQSQKPAIARQRGKRYQEVKKLVDVNKYYPLSEAAALVKKVSLSKFEGRVEAHLVVTETGNLGEISFPHLETASKKIVILDDSVLAEIKDGKINFDVIVATPATMPKLLPFARLLGPKGLMPNPKNGTLTDKPEEAVKRLSVAKAQIKTEAKAPVVHIIVGKVSQPEVELIANVEELIKVIRPNRIKKLVLCPTMGPSVKVEILK